MATPSTISAAVLWILAIIGVGFPTVASAASYRWENVPIHGGGFVSGLEFHPTEPGLLYARTDVGGAYRYDTANSRWIPLNDSIGGLDNAFMELGVASLALDPNEPDRLYLACGQYVAPWAPQATLLRSTDRGATWARTTLPFQLDGNSDGRNTGENLVVDPHLGSVLLLGTPDAGLWRSTDHGASFTRLTAFPAGNVTWVLFDRRSGTAGSPSQTIYAGVAVTTPGSPSVFRSTDAGTTWSALPGQPTALVLSSGDTGSTQPIPQHGALAYDATGRLFITYGNALGPNGVTTGAVWRYDTSSGAWTNVTPTPAPPAQQGGFGGVSVSAQNPAVIAVSTLGRWGPSPGEEIYRSTDGGATWSSRLHSGTRDHSSAPWAASLNPHWIGDVEIDPANADRALFVTGYGVYQTTNFTATAPTWAFHNAGLEETVPTGLVSPSSGPALVSVIGDFDGFRHDDVTGPPPSARHSPRHGSNRSLAAASLAPGIMARTFGGHPGAPRGAYSTDGAATWTDFATSPSTTANPGSIAVNADGTRFVWNQIGLVPHLSTNAGASWSPATGSVPAGSHAPVADPVEPLRFYIYDSKTGILHRSTDGGASFTTAASGLPTAAIPPATVHIPVLVAAPGREGDLWLAAWDQGLHRSTDAGTSFASVHGVQRAYRLGFGRAADGAYYPTIYLWGRIGGIDALWRSTDTARTWERISDDAHNFGYIDHLIGDPRRFGRVYFGTSGRGIIYGDPADAPPSTTSLPTAGTGATSAMPASSPASPAAPRPTPRPTPP